MLSLFISTRNSTYGIYYAIPYGILWYPCCRVSVQWSRWSETLPSLFAWGNLISVRMWYTQNISCGLLIGCLVDRCFYHSFQVIPILVKITSSCCCFLTMIAIARPPTREPRRQHSRRGYGVWSPFRQSKSTTLEEVRSPTTLSMVSLEDRQRSPNHLVILHMQHMQHMQQRIHQSTHMHANRLGRWMGKPLTDLCCNADNWTVTMMRHMLIFESLNTIWDCYGMKSHHCSIWWVNRLNTGFLSVNCVVLVSGMVQNESFRMGGLLASQ